MVPQCCVGSVIQALVESGGSHSRLPEPTAARRQGPVRAAIVGSHSGLTESETLGTGPATCVLTRTVILMQLRLENHWSRAWTLAF